MKLKIIILLFGVLYAYYSKAQIITLVATDSLNGTRIGGAMARSVEGVIYHSDKKGIIRMPCPSGWIYIQAGGYHPDSIRIHCPDSIHYIKLCSDEIHLDVFEVKGWREKESGMQVTRVHKQDIEINRLNTTAEMIQHIPGISLIKTGNGTTKPVIRGLTGNRVLHIYDGFRQEGQQWGLDHGMEVDPSGIGNIRVLKGAGSILYGSEASGGVILMNPIAYRPALGSEGNTYISLNSNNRGMSVSQQYLYTTKKWSLKASSHFKYAGDGHTPEYNLSNTGIRNANAQCYIRFGNPAGYHEISWVHFYQKSGILRASHADNITSLQQMILLGKPVIIKPFTYTIKNPRQEVLQEQLNYRYKKVRRSGWIQMISQSIQWNYRNEFDVTNPILGSAAVPNFSGSLGYSFSEYKIERHFQNNWNIFLGGQHHLLVNMSQGRRYLIPDFHTHKTGIMGLAEHESGRWRISIGSRFDYIYNLIYQIKYQTNSRDQRSYHGISGMLSASYRLGRGFYLEAQSGSGWRAPHVSELYTSGFHGATGNFEKGNPMIEKEQFFNQEFSLHKYTDQLQLELSIFYNYFKNYIYLRPTGKAITTINGSFPEMLYEQNPVALWGGELNVTYQTSNRHGFNSGLNYLRSKNLHTGYAIWLLPPSRGYINYKFQHPKKEWSAQLEYQYISAQKYVQPGTDFAPPPPAYGLWSCIFSGNIILHHRKWNLSLVVNNILNKNYRDYLSRYRYFADETGRDFKLIIHIPYNNTQKHIH